MSIAVRIREVGPRDGLQAEEPVDVAERVRLIDALAAAGLHEIEAVSFVSPKAVPSMAGAGDVMAAITRAPGVRYVALVPNVKGAELALEANVDALSVTVSASPAYNEKNVRMTVDESVESVAGIAKIAAPLPIDAVVSCAFGSPYEGDLEPADVDALGRRLLDAGATSLTYADTTGMATPRRVDDLLDRTGIDVGLHLHETRGTALVNAYAAVERGVRRFDTSVGGLGGSPFAAGAAGNLATEDLVHLLDDLGLDSGVDLDKLLDVSAEVARVVGHAVPSRIAAAGPRSRLSSS
ncbi:MAG: hydroxymethylglutaryl-CoA lyase [Actinobacteria bacterium]|nr:hydroxymethylglutaryl-CoA lyase [Actinomycetota bacterium]MBV9666243.1 hydroxymethylglutaryl-CoA lyase [Actinomycetota bacterium]MBV9934438.1 hydroxymethylglutaryl-CoA lyase [Actinomycetota bacterium]